MEDYKSVEHVSTQLVPLQMELLVSKIDMLSVAFTIALNNLVIRFMSISSVYPRRRSRLSIECICLWEYRDCYKDQRALRNIILLSVIYKHNILFTLWAKIQIANTVSGL